jgi:6-phosphogluconolactonase (cycloisomerase 2 family)
MTLARVATCATDAYPHGLNISPDGKHVVATGFSADHVRVLDAASGHERARLEVGQGSAHTGFLPDGRTAFIGCSISNHLAVIDVVDGRRVGMVTLN